MKRTTKLCLSLALVLSLLAGVAGTPAAFGQAKAGGATVIRTVDLVKAFNKLLQKADGDNEIKDLNDKLDKQGAVINKELDALKTELGSYNNDSELFRQTEEKLLKKASDLASHQDFKERRLLLEQRLKTLKIYAALRKGIEEYAKENGISLVLMADEPNLIAARSQEELLAKIAMKKVVYADENLDITQAVVQKLNTEYMRDKEKKKP